MLALALFLFSAVDIRLKYYDRARVFISFLCFDLILYNFGNEIKKKKRPSPSNIKNLVSLINGTLSVSEIKVKRLYIPEFSKIQFINGIKHSLLSALIAYISTKSVKIKKDEHFMQKKNSTGKIDIDITVRGRIISLGITLLRSYISNNR